MFTDLSSREESFEKFLSTFNLLAPHARIELNAGQRAFRWQGKFASASGFSWWEVESEIDWTCRFAQQKQSLGLVRVDGAACCAFGDGPGDGHVGGELLRRSRQELDRLW